MESGQEDAYKSPCAYGMRGAKGKDSQPLCSAPHSMKLFTEAVDSALKDAVYSPCTTTRMHHETPLALEYF